MNHKIRGKKYFLPGLNQRIKINLTRIIKSEEKSIFLPGLNQYIFLESQNHKKISIFLKTEWQYVFDTMKLHVIGVTFLHKQTLADKKNLIETKNNAAGYKIENNHAGPINLN